MLWWAIYSRTYQWIAQYDESLDSSLKRFIDEKRHCREHEYILKTAKGSYYVGSTDNIENRLKRHNAGCVKSTANKLPVELMFKEYYPTKSLAQRKEYKIKSWKSKKMIEKLIEQGPFV